MIGQIQVNILKSLHDASDGLPISDLLKEYRYKQGGKRSLASLERAGYIRITKDIAHFERFPDEMEPRVTIKTYSAEQLKELDDLSRQKPPLPIPGRVGEVQGRRRPSQCHPHWC